MKIPTKSGSVENIPKIEYARFIQNTYETNLSRERSLPGSFDSFIFGARPSEKRAEEAPPQPA